MPLSNEEILTLIEGETEKTRVSRNQINKWLEEAAEYHGISDKLPYLQQMLHIESGGDVTATSHKGARGLMQLMPETAKAMGVKNIYDPRENIFGGVKYFKQMYDTFGDVQLALAAYNAGPGNVQKYKGIPPFKETQSYVKKIYNAVRRLIGPNKAYAEDNVGGGMLGYKGLTNEQLLELLEGPQKESGQELPQATESKGLTDEQLLELLEGPQPKVTPLPTPAIQSQPTITPPPAALHGLTPSQLFTQEGMARYMAESAAPLESTRPMELLPGTLPKTSPPSERPVRGLTPEDILSGKYDIGKMQVKDAKERARLLMMKAIEAGEAAQAERAGEMGIPLAKYIYKRAAKGEPTVTNLGDDVVMMRQLLPPPPYSMAKAGAAGMLGVSKLVPETLRWFTDDKYGKDASKWFDQRIKSLGPLPTDFPHQLASAFGSSLPFYATMLGTAGLTTLGGLSATLSRVISAGAPAITEALLNAGGVYGELKDRGEDSEEANAAAQKVFLTQVPLNAATDYLTLGPLFGNKGLVRNFLNPGMSQGLQEAGQYISEQWAKKDKIEFGEAAEQFAVAGVLGLFLGPLGGAAGRFTFGNVLREVAKSPAEEKALRNQLVNFYTSMNPTGPTEFEKIDEILSNNEGAVLSKMMQNPEFKRFTFELSQRAVDVVEKDIDQQDVVREIKDVVVPTTAAADSYDSAEVVVIPQRRRPHRFDPRVMEETAVKIDQQIPPVTEEVKAEPEVAEVKESEVEEVPKPKEEKKVGRVTKPKTPTPKKARTARLDPHNSPFRQEKEVTEYRDNLFLERPPKDIGTIMAYHLNQVNKWLDGDDEVSIDKSRHALSTLAAAARNEDYYDKLINIFGTDKDVREFQVVISSAAQWAQDIDRRILEKPKTPKRTKKAEPSEPSEIPTSEEKLPSKIDSSTEKSLEDYLAQMEKESLAEDRKAYKKELEKYYGKPIDEISDKELKDYFDKKTSSKGVTLTIGLNPAEAVEAIRKLWSNVVEDWSKGKTVQEIWEKTGFFLNPYDRKWRFYIDEEEASLTNEFHNMPETGPLLVNPAHSRPLKKVLFHPKLYQHAPWLAQVPVYKRSAFLDIFGRTQGFYDPFDKTLSISPMASNPLSTLIHEVTHAVQHRADWAAGGDTKIALERANLDTLKLYAQDALVKLEEEYNTQVEKQEGRIETLDALQRIKASGNIDEYTKLRQRIRDLSDQINNLPPLDTKEIRDEYIRLVDEKTNAIEELCVLGGYGPRNDFWLGAVISAGFYERYNLLKKDIEGAAKRIDELSQLIRTLETSNPDALRDAIQKSTDVSYSAYKNLAGEIEARDNQLRMESGDYQRLPLTSERISPRRIIVVPSSTLSTYLYSGIDPILFKWYFSKLGQIFKTMRNKIPRKGTGKSYSAMLNNWVKKGIIKQEEVDFVLGRFLDEKEDEKITVDDLENKFLERQIHVVTEKGPQVYNEYTLESRQGMPVQNHTIIHFKLPPYATTFETHIGEIGSVLWIRTTTPTDRVLRLQETQSDLHRDARRYGGYLTEKDVEEKEAALTRIVELDSEISRLKDMPVVEDVLMSVRMDSIRFYITNALIDLEHKLGKSIDPREFMEAYKHRDQYRTIKPFFYGLETELRGIYLEPTEEVITPLVEYVQAVREKETLRNRLRMEFGKRVPIAPFRSTWPEIGIKYALFRAAALDYDVLEFPTAKGLRIIEGPPEGEPLKVLKFEADMQERWIRKEAARLGMKVEWARKAGLVERDSTITQLYLDVAFAEEKLKETINISDNTGRHSWFQLRARIQYRVGRNPRLLENKVDRRVYNSIYEEYKQYAPSEARFFFALRRYAHAKNALVAQQMRLNSVEYLSNHKNILRYEIRELSSYLQSVSNVVYTEIYNFLTSQADNLANESITENRFLKNVESYIKSVASTSFLTDAVRKDIQDIATNACLVGQLRSLAEAQPSPLMHRAIITPEVRKKIIREGEDYSGFPLFSGIPFHMLPKLIRSLLSKSKAPEVLDFEKIDVRRGRQREDGTYDWTVWGKTFPKGEWKKLQTFEKKGEARAYKQAKLLERERKITDQVISIAAKEGGFLNITQAEREAIVDSIYTKRQFEKELVVNEESLREVGHRKWYNLQRKFYDDRGPIRRELIKRFGEDGARLMSHFIRLPGGIAFGDVMVQQMIKEMPELSAKESNVLNEWIFFNRLRAIWEYKPDFKVQGYTPGRVGNNLRRFAKDFDLTDESMERIKKAGEVYFKHHRLWVDDLVFAGLKSVDEGIALKDHDYSKLSKLRTLADLYDSEYEIRQPGEQPMKKSDSGVDPLGKGGGSLFEKRWQILASETARRIYGRVFNNQTKLALKEFVTTHPDSGIAWYKGLKDKNGEPMRLPKDYVVEYYFEPTIIDDNDVVQRKAIYIHPEVYQQIFTIPKHLSDALAHWTGYITGAHLVRNLAVAVSPVWASTRGLVMDILHGYFSPRTKEGEKFKAIFSPILPVYLGQLGKNITAVIGDAYTHGEKFIQYAKYGGMTVPFLSQRVSLETGKKHLPTGWDKFMDALGAQGRALETTIRLAIMDRVVGKEAAKLGMDKEELWGVESAKAFSDILLKAANTAIEHMPYGQVGWVTRALDRAVPFLSANMVANRSAWRSLIERPVDAGIRITNIMAASVLMTLVSALGDPERDRDIPSFDKERNATMPYFPKHFDYVDKTGRRWFWYITIPLSSFPGLWFHLGRFMTEQALYDLGFTKREPDIKSILRVMKNVATDAAPMSAQIPTVSMFMSYIQGTDPWTKERIGDKILDFPKSYVEGLYDPNVPAWARSFGQYTGMSPRRLYYSSKAIVPRNEWTWLTGAVFEPLFETLPPELRRDSMQEIVAGFPGVKSFLKLAPVGGWVNEERAKEEQEVVFREFERRARFNNLMRQGDYGVEVRPEVQKFIRELERNQEFDEATKFQNEAEAREYLRRSPEKSLWLPMIHKSGELQAMDYYRREKVETSPQERERLLRGLQHMRAAGLIKDTFDEELSKLRRANK